jgi:hypothetical protein
MNIKTNNIKALQVKYIIAGIFYDSGLQPQLNYNSGDTLLN